MKINVHFIAVSVMVLSFPGLALWPTAQGRQGVGNDDSPAPEEKADDRHAEHGPLVPDWAVDARWYHVVVPAFGDVAKKEKGETQREPAAVPEKSERGATAGHDNDADADAGPLHELRRRLPYFKELGVNTLYLSDLFVRMDGGERVDLRHVDGSLGGEARTEDTADRLLEPATWRYLPADRAFLKLVRAAHRENLRIVVEAPFARAAATAPMNERMSYLLAVTRRWMKPDGDDNAIAGVDGWVVTEPEKLRREFWKQWRKQVKDINPQALLVVDSAEEAASWVAADGFDTTIDRHFARRIERFLGPDGSKYATTTFLSDLTTMSRRLSGDSQLAAPVPVSSPERRLLNAVSLRRQPAGEKEENNKPPSVVSDRETGRARWQLANMIQSFLPGAPMVYYGDEAGMLNTKEHHTGAPMRWDHLAGAAAVNEADPDRSAPLIQWLNICRERFGPLRRGAFQTIVLDAQRRLFALSRSLADSEVILVVNASEEKQKAMLPAGRLGELVVVLTPQLRTVLTLPGGKPEQGELLRPLRLGASRQVVDAAGRIRIWVDPMSARVVIIRKNNAD